MPTEKASLDPHRTRRHLAKQIHHRNIHQNLHPKFTTTQFLKQQCLKTWNRQIAKRLKALVTAASFAMRSITICLLLQSNQLQVDVTARSVINQPSHQSDSPVKMTLNFCHRPHSKRLQTINGSRRTSTGTFVQSAAFKSIVAASTNCQAEKIILFSRSTLWLWTSRRMGWIWRSGRFNIGMGGITTGWPARRILPIWWDVCDGGSLQSTRCRNTKYSGFDMCFNLSNFQTSSA